MATSKQERRQPRPERAPLTHDEVRTRLLPRLAAVRRLLQLEPGPVEAWILWAIHRMSCTPPPAWVLEYLDEVAYGVISIAYSRPRKSRRAARVAQALDLMPKGPGRRPDAFDAYFDQEDERIGDAMEIRMESGCSYEVARDDLADEHRLSPSTVERRYRRHRAKKGGASSATKGS